MAEMSVLSAYPVAQTSTQPPKQQETAFHKCLLSNNKFEAKVIKGYKL